MAPRAAAQFVAAGDYVVSDFNQNTLWRIAPTGAISLLYSGVPFGGVTSVAFTRQGELLATDFRNGELYRFNAAGVPSLVLAGLNGPIRVRLDRNGDYLITELSNATLSRVTPAGVRSTIHAGVPFSRPFDVAVDANGDYLVVDDSNDALYRVPRVGGAVQTIHSGFPFRLPQGVTVGNDGDIYVSDALADSVYRVQLSTGNITTVVTVPTLGNPEAIIANFDGSFALCEAGIPNGPRIVNVDRNGGLRIVAQNGPLFGLEDIARMPHLTGPESTPAPGSYPFPLDFPGEGFSFYAMWVSLSVTPGLEFSSLFVDPTDLRSLPANADPFFLASFAANSAVFVGWGGTLSATGTATPMLTIPQVQLPPFTLTLQAMTFDPNAQNGVRSISNAHPIRLR